MFITQTVTRDIQKSDRKIQNNHPHICVAVSTSETFFVQSIWIDCLLPMSEIEQLIDDLCLLAGTLSWQIIDHFNWHDHNVDYSLDLHDLMGEAHTVYKYGQAYTAFRNNYFVHSEELFNEVYQGQYESECDFAEEYYEQETGQTLDYDCIQDYANDLFPSQFYFENGYVFKRV